MPFSLESAFAQTEELRFKLPEPGESASRSARKNRVEFRLEQSDYFSSDRAAFRDDAATGNTSLIVRADYLFGRERGLQFKLKGKNEYSLAENWNYGDVHELYGAWRGANVQLSLGRKLETWAAWDSEWKLGVFQPRYMENRLHIEEAGLTGLFLNTQSEKFSATLAYLPANIPDFGPHFYSRDGSLYSRNPWFHPPTDRFVLRTGKGDIRYSIEQPDAMSVVNQPGGAVKFEYRSEKFVSRVSAAYKPLSSLLLAFPSERREILLENDDYFKITILPRVAYDRIVSWDNLYRDGKWNYSLSAAHDHPDDNGGRPEWTAQQVRPANIFAGHVERELNEGGARVQLGFLKIHGGDAQDRGKFAGDKTLFDRRFIFYEAYMLNVKKNFVSAFAFPSDVEMKVIYDRMQQGGILSLGAGMNFSREFRASLQADFIGLLSASAPIVDGFFDTYRSNDRLGLGVSYVF